MTSGSVLFKKQMFHFTFLTLSSDLITEANFFRFTFTLEMVRGTFSNLETTRISPNYNNSAINFRPIDWQIGSIRLTQIEKKNYSYTGHSDPKYVLLNATLNKKGMYFKKSNSIINLAITELNLPIPFHNHLINRCSSNVSIKTNLTKGYLHVTVQKPKNVLQGSSYCSVNEVLTVSFDK